MPDEVVSPAHVEMEAGEESLADVAAQWAADYPDGAALFCAQFGADDFDADWGSREYPDGATVAIRRSKGTPPQGWVLAHAHLSDLERTKVILQRHASPEAWQVLTDLGDDAFEAFVKAWGKDGGLDQGKSPRSARRSGSSKRR